MWRLEHSLGSDNLSPRGVFQTDLVDMERHFLVALSTTLCTLSGAQTRSHDVPACEYVLQMISMKTHWYANSRATHGPVSVRHYSHGTALTRISLQYDSACLCLGAFFFLNFFYVSLCRSLGNCCSLCCSLPLQMANEIWSPVSLNDKTHQKENTTTTTMSFSLAVILSLLAASKQPQTFGTKSQSVLSGNRKALN